MRFPSIESTLFLNFYYVCITYIDSGRWFL